MYLNDTDTPRHDSNYPLAHVQLQMLLNLNNSIALSNMHYINSKLKVIRYVYRVVQISFSIKITHLPVEMKHRLFKICLVALL